jgi:hypothetical protein
VPIAARRRVRRIAATTIVLIATIEPIVLDRAQVCASGLQAARDEHLPLGGSQRSPSAGADVIGKAPSSRCAATASSRAEARSSVW